MIMMIAAGGFILLLGIMLLGGDSGKSGSRRAANFSGDDKVKKGAFSFLKGGSDSSRRKQIEESLGDIEDRIKDKNKARKTLKARLIQADLSISAQTFTLISIGLGVVTAFIAYVILNAPILQTLGAAGTVGFGLPRWVLGFMINKRQAKFTMHFSDAMDIIVRGVRTGLPLGDCLKMIAHESPEPVREEFGRVVEAEAVGVPIEVCLERMYDRMPLSEVKFFATVLNIQRSTGGNLGEALSNLSGVLRGRKLLREKIKALAAEAKASAIIIGCLPPGVMLLVTVVSPDYMIELYTTTTGHRNLMIGAFMMLAGTGVMRKMINFKF